MKVAELRRRVRNSWRHHEIGITIGLLLLLLAVVYFSSNIFITVEAGHRGILWSRFSGTVTDRFFPEGLHVIAPWNVMAIYDVRFQTVNSSIPVLSKDGLSIGVEITARYRPSDKQLGHLHQQVGPDYVKTVVLPEVGNAVRLVISRYRPDELYAAGFAEIEKQIVAVSREQIHERYVTLDDVLVRALVLPVPVAEAIQRKLEQEQASLEMKFRLARERQEAERKTIEATGIRSFGDIAGASLTAGYLRLRGIEATLELAKSTNAKVIVIGSGTSGGQPLIFDADMFGASPPVTPAPRVPPR